MANISKLDSYAMDLSALKLFYNNAPDKREVEMKAQALRVKALADGVDLVQLEKRAHEIASLPAPDMSIANKTIQQAQYIAQLQQAKLNYIATKSEQYHQEAQNIRIQALQNGYDLMELEDRTFYSMKGRVMNADERADAKKYIDDLVAKYKNGQATPPLPTTTQSPSVPARTSFSNGAYYGETFSGSDMVVFLAFPGYKPVSVGTATTISYTTYREKKQFRVCGQISSRGITKGGRTISGKMIFTVMNQHIIEDLRQEIPYLRIHRPLLMDELPPFDIIVSFGNEYGNSAGLIIQGVTTVDEQKTLSIEELFTENIFTYLARRLEPMRQIGTLPGDPYNPLNFAPSTELRNLADEAIGKFNLSDTILADMASKIPDTTGMTSGPESWEQVLDQIYSEGKSGTIPVATTPTGPTNAPPTTGASTPLGSASDSRLLTQVWDTQGNRTIQGGKLAFTTSAGNVYVDNVNYMAVTKDLLYGLNANDLNRIHMDLDDLKYHFSLADTELHIGKNLKIEFKDHPEFKNASANVVSKQGWTFLLLTPERKTTSQRRIIDFFTGDGGLGFINTWYDMAKMPSDHTINPITPIDVTTFDKARQTLPQWDVKANSILEVKVLTNQGAEINHAVYFKWELIPILLKPPLDMNDKVAWDLLDKANGLQSSKAFTKLGIVNNMTSRSVVKTGLDGFARVNINEFFVTVATNGRMMSWNDMPTNMILKVIATTKQLDGTQLPAQIAMYFRKS